MARTYWFWWPIACFAVGLQQIITVEAHDMTPGESVEQRYIVSPFVFLCAARFDLGRLARPSNGRRGQETQRCCLSVGPSTGQVNMRHTPFVLGGTGIEEETERAIRAEENDIFVSGRGWCVRPARLLKMHDL